MKPSIPALIVLSMLALSGGSARAATNTLIAYGSTWKYLDNGTDQGTAWRGTSFNDTAWASGPAQLGYSSNPAENDEATIVSFGPDPNNKYITTYFRRTFSVSNPASYTNLVLYLLRDDAGVVYLNGTEIFRSPNLPAAPTLITSATLATGAAVENFLDVADVSSALGLLVSGNNVIAAEIHQLAVNSSDISFDLQLLGVNTAAPDAPPTVNLFSPANNSTFNAPTNVLIQANATDPDGTVSKVEFFRDSVKIGEDTTSPFSLNWTNALVGTFQLTAVATDNGGVTGVSLPISVTFTGAAPATLIAFGAVWKYLDNGSDQGTAWRPIAFNDGAWASGPAPLGYGDVNGVLFPATTTSFGLDPNNKYITTYFRRAFNVANPSAYSFLSVQFRRDDGIVIYLNGTEVVRNNFASGTTDILFNTPAQLAFDDGSALFTNNLPANLLVAGNNVVAVEVHQNNGTSSDIIFDLELLGNTGAIINNPPTVGLSSPANNSTFTEPAAIAINATAGDSDGSVSKVEFFASGTKIGEDTTSPYSFTWGGVAAGNYTLSAVATDNLGSSSTSAVVNVSVVPSTAPTLLSHSPASATVGSLTQIILQFSEPVDGVDASDLLINFAPATSVTASNNNTLYTFTFPQPMDGVVSVGFANHPGIVDRESPPKPFDATAPNASWQYTLADTLPPTALVIAPSPAATVKSLTEIRVTFSEAVGGVNASDLRINGTNAASVSGAGPGPYVFHFTQPANGAVSVAWAAGHGVHDFAATPNAFAGGSWNYVLNTNAPETNIVISEIMFHPSSERADEEYLELFNKGSSEISLTGWRLHGGVDFSFPSYPLGAGKFLVIAANRAAFSAKYPGVTNVLAGWLGRLSNTDDDLNLDDAAGERVDSVHYADEGDWSYRVRDPLYPNTGWAWSDDADGGGKSLELMNANLPNQYGQNWAASVPVNGTPGAANSRATNNIAPMLLDVAHSPIVPKSTDAVTITARLLDELSSGFTVTLFYRDASTATPAAFSSAAMFDDGLHGDGVAGDRVYGALLPAMPNRTVIEFYVQASDATAHTRTWPAAARQSDGTTFAQTANALYQVDDTVYTGNQPFYRLIMTETERALLDDLAHNNPQSNAEMNNTFITSDGVGTELRYNCSTRIRGAGSRGRIPPNYRLRIASDHRWHGLTARNLNTQFPYSQIAGSVFSRKSGLHSEEAIAVQVRVNGDNLANAGCPDIQQCQYGSYNSLESRDSDWADNQFPDDPNGNLYTCTRPDANLLYRGTDPGRYTSYEKDTNKGENDYSDIIHLCDVLNNTPDGQYAAAVRQVADVEGWVRYFAVLAMVGYDETSIGSDGAPDDFTLYRGLNDPRFRIIPHDHDTDFGQGDTSNPPTQYGIFRPTDGNTVVNRFLKFPEFVPLYYAELYRLCNTTFTSGEANKLFDDSLSSWVPTQIVTGMKNWVAARRAFVLSQIPLNLTINPPALSIVNGYYRTTTPTLNLDGLANAIETRSVKVNGQFASWTAWQATWSASVTLTPGINRIVVESFDQNARLLQASTIDVWYDDGSVASVSGPVSGGQTWTAAGGPYQVTANLSVGDGASLSIQPGTTVYLNSGVTITVSGSGVLLAQGTAGQHIRFTRLPGAGANWGSLDFIGASAESRLAYVDIDSCGGTTIGGHNAELHVNGGSRVFFDHLAFANTPVVEYISFDGSSFIVQNCIFPTYPPPTGPEMLHGLNGIPAGGYGIFRDNYFGHTYGFNDTIDFTGGQRPGAILQVINNVFDGASDDHLDLDSTDAWIEGNIFLHAHRDPTRTDDARDTASAISGGVDFANQFSEWTIINNLFYDVDHACLNKGGGSPGAGRFVFVNNTLVHVAKENGGGLVSDIAAFDFTDDGVPLPDASYGAGAYVAGNIIWDCPALVANYNPANHTVIFENNLLPLPWTGPGTNNVVADPQLNLALLTNVATADWKLVQAAFQPRAGSPALGTGRGGFDKGGLNPRGILVFGEPASTTPLNSATLTVAPGGTFNWGTVVPPYEWGYTRYKWKLDNGPWSAEISITTSPAITLTGLSQGAHTVSVVGKNDAGFYQDDTFVYPATAGLPAHVTSSRSWIVNSMKSVVRLNEILARNDAAVPVSGKFPDLIELYNPSGNAVSLAGFGLTDEADNPFKFSFPGNATIGAGQYLVLYADSEVTPAGYHLGFALKQNGDEVFLTMPSGMTADAVVFGMQLADLSIARMPDGSWRLGVPTFGAANLAARTGDPRKLKINEWLANGLTPFPDDFVELFNPDPLPVALGDLFLTDNPNGAPMRHDIAPLSFVAGGGYAVFTADGNPEQGPDHLSFKLSADQGLIGLVAADGSLIDCVIYGPQTTDVSMGRQPNGSSTYGFFPSPTPGAPNPGIVVLGQTVVLNEVLALNTVKRDANGNTPDWVELYNPTATIIDLGDMSLSDDAAVPRKYVFPAGSRISALGFRAIKCDPDFPPSTNNAGFGLKSTGQGLYLFDKLANGGGELSAVSFGVQAADFSIGRRPDGSTNWVLALESIGAPNNNAVVLGDPATLKVNEWMANPDSGDDWFEIYNPNLQPAALGGRWLSDNIATPASRMKHKIAPLSFIGVGGWAFQRFEADNNLAAGPEHVNFKLDATLGEQIGISSATGVLIDGVTFGPQAPGISQGRLPDGTANIVSFPGSASPGDPNFLLLTNVVVNEVLSHSDPPFEDAIELRNLSASSVNIGGWYLSDAKHSLKKYRIPDGTMLPPNGPTGFKVFYEYQFNDTNSGFGFSLNSAKGDDVYLAQTTTGDALTGYRAQASFGAAENAVSFGRYMTSVGEAHYVAMSQRTFGADNPDTVTAFRLGTGRTNAYPKVGPIVISEIMYHPPDIGGTNENFVDEFIELRNITSTSQPLFHPIFTTNSWKLKNAVSFTFPPNTSIPADGFLLVVGFDPADTAQLIDFRDRYNVQPGTPIVGPWSGKLDNSGESVELYKPDAPQTAPDPDAGLVPSILVDKVHYSDRDPWPGADGDGQSLQRVNLNEYGNDPINWMAGPPTPGPQASPTDSDGDGMDDAWELSFFGTLSHNGTGDSDGDGLTDRQEFQLGTDPTNAASPLRLRVVSSKPSTVLQFNAAANQGYTVEFKNALTLPSWTLLQSVPAGTARSVQITDPSAPSSNRFYRLRSP